MSRLLSIGILFLLFACTKNEASTLDGARELESQVAVNSIPLNIKENARLFVGKYSMRTDSYDFQYEVVESSTLRQCLANMALSKEQFASITRLDIAGLEIISLDGIQDLPELEYVYIQHANISSIDELANLHKLRIISLSYSPVHYLPRGGIDGLEHLSIDWVPLDSYAQLSEFKDLKRLRFSYNQRNEKNASSVAEELMLRGVDVKYYPWDLPDQVTRPELKMYY